MKKMMDLINCLAWIYFFINGCSCLKMIGVKVPKKASVGDTVTIHCLYDLEGQKLYSLKWHFNGSEFYRLYGSKLTDHFSHTQQTTPPSLTSYSSSSSSSSRGNKKKNHHRTSQQTSRSDKNSPNYYNSNPFSIQLFPVAGVDVDEMRSQNGSIVLRNITFLSSGRYGCEVSVDKTFETDIQADFLIVSSGAVQACGLWWCSLRQLLLLLLLHTVINYQGLHLVSLGESFVHSMMFVQWIVSLFSSFHTRTHIPDTRVIWGERQEKETNSWHWQTHISFRTLFHSLSHHQRQTHFLILPPQVTCFSR